MMAVHLDVDVGLLSWAEGYKGIAGVPRPHFPRFLSFLHRPIGSSSGRFEDSFESAQCSKIKQMGVDAGLLSWALKGLKG